MASLPVATPPEGTYYSTQSVVLSSPSGGIVVYTTDGSDPTSNGAVYSSPIAVTHDMVITAFAFNSGDMSAVTTFTYVFGTPDPVAAPGAGMYETAQSVMLTAASGASILYTLDGTDPWLSKNRGTWTDPADGHVYRTALLPDGNWWLAENYRNALGGSSFNGDSSNDATYGLEYTWDGATALVTSSIRLPTSTEFNALYAAVGGVNTAGTALKSTSALWTSGAGDDTYGFNALPSGWYDSGLPNPGHKGLGTLATFWCADAYSGTRAYIAELGTNVQGGMESYYKTVRSGIRFIVVSNNVPDSHGSLYSTALQVQSTVNVKAIAALGTKRSSVVAFAYTIRPPLTAPSATPGSGAYVGAQSVTLSASGDNIAYTVDGTDPVIVAGSVTQGSTYTEPVEVASSSTIKAVSYNGTTSSAVQAFAYVISTLPEPAAPKFGIISGDTIQAPTVLPTAMRIEPMFGDEENVYKRLIYGTETQSGIPTGVFYDTRALPLPYMPRVRTPLLFVFDSENLGVEHEIIVTRENATEFCSRSSRLLITPTVDTYSHVIPTQLGQGLNTIDVLIDGTVIYTAVFTSTVYGLFLHSIAREIQSNIVGHLDELENALFRVNSTRLLEVYLGAVTQLFPAGTVEYRMVTQLVLSGIMNNAGSTAGFADIGSITGSTPKVFAPDTTSNLLESWLLPIRSFAAKLDQVVLLWGRDVQSGRGVAFSRFMRARGFAIDHETSLFSTRYVDGVAHVMYGEPYDVREPEEFAEISCASSIALLPEAGAYVIPCTVSVSADDLTTVYYTTDGSIPTTASPIWTGDIALTHTQVVSVLGVKAGEPDVVIQRRYAIVYPVPSSNNSMLSYDPTSGTAAAHMGYEWMAGASTPAPTFSPAAGLFAAVADITITAATGRVIHYTLDGSTPTESSPLYTGPIHITALSTIIKAASFASTGGGRSEIAFGDFRVLPVVASPESVIVNDSVHVALSGPSGLPIYYALADHDVFATDNLYTGPFDFTVSKQVSVAVVTPDAGASPTRLLEYTVVTPPILYPVPGSYLRYEDERLDILSDPKITSVDPLVAYTTDGTAPDLTTQKTTETSIIPNHRLAPVPSGTHTINIRAMAGTVMSPVIGGTYNYHDAVAVCHDVHWFNPVTGRYGYLGYKATNGATTIGICEFDPQYLTDVNTTTPDANTTRFEYGAYSGFANTVAYGGMISASAVFQNAAVDEVTGIVYISYTQDIGNSQAIVRHAVLAVNTVTGAFSHPFLSDPYGVYYGNAIKWTYETPTALAWNPETNSVIMAVMRTDNTAAGGFQKNGNWHYESQGGVSSFFMRSLSFTASPVWGTTWYWTIDDNTTNRWSCVALFVKNGLLYGAFHTLSDLNYNDKYSVVISRVQVTGFTDVTASLTDLGNMLLGGLRDQYPAYTASIVCDASGVLWFQGYLIDSEVYAHLGQTVNIETHAPHFTAANGIIYYPMGTNVAIRVPATWDDYTVVSSEPSITTQFDGFQGGAVLRRGTGDIVLRGFKSGIKSGVTIPNRSSVFTAF